MLMLPPMANFAIAEVLSAEEGPPHEINLVTGGEAFPDPTGEPGNKYPLTLWKTSYGDPVTAYQNGYAHRIFVTGRTGDVLTIEDFPPVDPGVGWSVGLGFDQYYWEFLDSAIYSLQIAKTAGVVNFAEYGRADGPDNTAAFVDAVGAARDKAIQKKGATLVIPAGRFYTRQIIIPTDASIVIAGLSDRGTQIYQLDSADETMPLVATSGSGQVGPTIERMQLLSSVNGSHLIHLYNVKGARLNDLRLISHGQKNAASSHPDPGGSILNPNWRAACRLELCFGCDVRNIHLEGGSAFGFWVGDGETWVQQSTNNWLRTVYNYSVGVGSGFKIAAFFFHNSGNTVLRDSKVNALECEYGFWIYGGRQCKLDNVGCEWRVPAVAGIRIDNHVEPVFREVTSGNAVEQPYAIDATNVDALLWEHSLIRQKVKLTTCKGTVFQSCQFNSLTLEGDSITFPEFMVIDGRNVDANGEISDSFPGTHSNVGILKRVAVGSPGAGAPAVHANHLYLETGKVVVQGYPSSFLGTDLLPAASMHFWFDEADGTLRLRVKKANGDLVSLRLVDTPA